MFKRMLIMLILVGLVLGGVFGFKAYGKKMMMQHMAAMSNPAQTVSTTKAVLTEWQNALKAVGTLRAVQGTDISSEVSGIVEAILVESGQDVEAGTLLVQLRSEEDKAQLEALKAKQQLAALTVERDEKQIKAKAISQATFDADLADLVNLTAQVAQQKAALDKKSVTAPFAGRLGIRKVDVGQYLNAGAAIIPLQQLDPIYLDFSLPQQDLPHIRVGQKIDVKTDVFPDKVFEGEISAIDSVIDEGTRNVSVRARLQNPDKSLRPGMFASVTIDVGAQVAYITLPQTAITFNPYGSTVFIVKDLKGAEKTVETAFVKTGWTRGDQIAVIEGLKEGDEIVTAGQMKLRNGSSVVVNNKVEPTNDPAPEPKDQ